MPLSLNGLQEGDFTSLRVLTNNVMQDVLSLTAAGSPDIPLGSLTVAQTAGLQSQLNAKATTAALSAIASSLGGEIDVLEEGVAAVGAAVASLGAAVATKAAQSELDATNATLATKASQSDLSSAATTLTTNLNNVSSLLGTRASSASVTAGLSLKQDLIGESLTLGALNIIGNSDVAILRHSEGVALQTDDGTLTDGVFTPAGATLRKLIVQNELVVPDDALEIT